MFKSSRRSMPCSMRRRCEGRSPPEKVKASVVDGLLRMKDPVRYPQCPKDRHAREKGGDGGRRAARPERARYCAKRTSGHEMLPHAVTATKLVPLWDKVADRSALPCALLNTGILNSSCLLPIEMMVRIGQTW